MCTLSLMPRPGGYTLAMNRDERITRPVAQPPQVRPGKNTSFIFPSDHAGGTWVGANHAGVSFALLNWNDQTSTAQIAPPRSRGLVIPPLLENLSLNAAQESLEPPDFRDMLPFRLVGVFLEEQVIWEWRWDKRNLDAKAWSWERRHWYSSSASDAHVERLRGEACCKAWAAEDAGTLPWLRRLHGSHAGGEEAFQICVHRTEVKTVSYTELMCTSEEITCRYFAGSPCEMREPELAASMQCTGRR